MDVSTVCPGTCGHLYQPSLPCFSDELATACVPLMLAAMPLMISVLSCPADANSFRAP